MISPIRFWVTTIFLAFFFAFLTAKLIQIQVVAPWPYHLNGCKIERISEEDTQE